MNDLIIARKKEMITLSLIQDEMNTLDQKPEQSLENIKHIVAEKLKQLMEKQTELKIKAPEMLMPSVPVM